MNFLLACLLACLSVATNLPLTNIYLSSSMTNCHDTRKLISTKHFWLQLFGWLWKRKLLGCTMHMTDYVYYVVAPKPVQ